MRKFLWIVLAALTVQAGGFYIGLGNPSASAEAKAKSAVLVARLTGCHEPEKATIEGTAEGVVEGQRQTIPLKFIALSMPGTYALQRQWPSEGNWIVRLVAFNPAGPASTSALVRVKGDSFERGGAKFVQRAPTADEVDAMLKRTE